MSTEQENNQQKPQIFEVEVILPEQVISGNDSLKNYNPENNTLNYKLAPETTEEFKEKIKEMMKGSTTNEIVLFNPVLQAVAYIQKFKNLKYNPENDNSEEYKKAMKTIGTFNSTVTATAKQIKQPRTAYNKIIVAIEALLKSESDNVKGALAENFKEYLDKEQKAKDDKIAKRDSVKNEQIAALTSENETNVANLSNQKKITRDLEIEKLINSVVIEVTEKLPSLNEEGLKALRQSTLDRKMGDPDTPDVTYTADEKTKFSKDWADKVLAAVKLIDDKIDSYKDKAVITNITTENQVLKANTPSGAFEGIEDDEPFEIPSTQPQQSQTEARKAPETDAEKIIYIFEQIELLAMTAQSVVNLTKAIEFTDPQLQSIHTKLRDTSLPNILEWTVKTMEWTEKRKTAYITFINQQTQNP